eukprot:7380494-Lingulodinium_polyedra.AAC.1
MDISQAPNIPHLGGLYVPSVSVATIQSRGKIRPRAEEITPEAPPQKAARQTADVPKPTDEPELSGIDDPDMI